MKKLTLLAVLGIVGLAFADTVDLNEVGDLSVTTLDSATDYTNSGAEVKTLTVNLAADVTYNGTISGKVRLVYASGGKVLTLGGNNSYTGGTEIRQGRITVMTSTALGGGDVAITASASASTAGSVAFGAEDLTLANAFTVSGADPGSVKDMRCTFYSTMKKSTVSGKITVTGDGVAINTQYGSPNYDVIFAFTGGIDAAGKVVNAAGNRKSTVKFDCDVSCFYFNGWHDSYVVLELSANHTFDIKCMRCKYTNISVYGTLSPDTTFYWNGNQAEDGRNLISIKKDQVINCISGTVCTAATGSNISGDSGRTLTLKAQASADAWVKFATGNTSDGAGTVAPINLVYDALDDDYVQSFHARASRLSGSITVKRGTVKVTDGASFKDVPTIDVQGGSFVLDSTVENALAGLTSLSVGNGAKFLLDDATVAPIVKPMKLTFSGDAEFHLPEGNLLEITELWVDGVRQAGGFYSTAAGEATKALSNISGGGKISVPHWQGEPLEIVEATWTDGGADDGFATAGNWSKSVSTTDESLLATFASAGEKADLSASAFVNGMVFDLADGLSGFTFTALNDSSVLNIGYGGVTAAERASVDDHLYTFDVPVRTGGPQTWALRANDRAVFRRPLTSLNAAAHMHFDGTPGSVVAFDKASPGFEAHMAFTNTCVQVGAPTAPFGVDGMKVEFIATDNAATSSTRPFLHVTNSCDVTSPIWFGGNAQMYALTIDANTTNTLKKVSYKYMTKNNWSAYTYAGPNSYTVFAEGTDAGSVVTYFCGTKEQGEKPVFEF